MLRFPRAAAAAVLAAAAMMPLSAAAPGGATAPPVVRPHAAFDTTTSPAPSHWVMGAPAKPLLHPRIPLRRGSATASGLGAQTGAPPDPEVLGFAQVGEVTSGAWSGDLRFNLLSTVAYFGLNINPNGTLSTGDSGYAGWRSSQLTDLMNAAHAAGDRVVLTIKSFDDGTINGATSTESARQTLIGAVINELRSRGGDGVNVDLEGVNSNLRNNFTTFVAELYSALRSQLPEQSYVTVDTYASAGLGGTMYDLTGLTPHLDAFDLMGYGFASGSEAGPTAPLHGDWYNVTQSVSDYRTRFGVPAAKLILGVPYYGYKWSVGSPVPGNDGMQPGSNDAADTYADALSDFSCALQLRRFWDATFAEPYATWWSPASGDPCGGNHNSWRELYYENAQALGYKYDLVNSGGLRGIGIWALGYDSGSSDLWNEIAAKFSVTHAPIATVSPLPSSEPTTGFTVAWTNTPGSPAVSRYVLWVQVDGGRWLDYTTTHATSLTVYGFPGHTYAFYVEAVGSNGYDSGGPAGAGQASTTVSPSAVWSNTAFRSMYAVNVLGSLLPGSSPAVNGPFWGWNIARGVAMDSTGEGGVVLDGWGGLHAFGDAGSAVGGGYWPGWDIAVAIAENGANQGYQLDGYGGLHPFHSNGAANPPAVNRLGAYWPGWKIARALALFPDGSGGVVLDGFGHVHPFTVAGVSHDAARPVNGPFWNGWDIARSVVLTPGSTSTHYGGYVLDGFGGIHPFGSAGATPPPAGPSAYWNGWDIARGLVLLPGSSSAGYMVDGWGTMHPFGGAPAVLSPSSTIGADLTRGLAIH